MAEKFSIDDLQPELIFHIFSYFTQQELLLTVAPVCQAWNDYVQSPSLWKTLVFWSGNPLINSDVLHACFKRAPFLHRLEFVGGRHAKFKPSVDDFRCCARLCPLLKDLRLISLPFLEFELLNDIIGLFPNLEKLSIAGCEHYNSQCLLNRSECELKHADEDFRCIRRICDLTNLRGLDLAYCEGIPVSAMELISSRLVRLEELNIDGVNSITDDAVEMLIRRLGDQLWRLNLDGEILSDASIRSVSRCHHLTCLTVYFSEQLTDLSLVHIKTLSTLRKLSLRKAERVTTAGLVSLFSGPPMSQLTYLDFSQCPTLNDAALMAICHCCGVRLRHLSLAWCCDITDVGIDQVCTNCRYLEHLDLTSLFKLTFDKFLLRVPHCLPYLTYLNLQMCELDRSVESLALMIIANKLFLKIVVGFGHTLSSSDFDFDSQE